MFLPTTCSVYLRPLEAEPSQRREKKKPDLKSSAMEPTTTSCRGGGGVQETQIKQRLYKIQLTNAGTARFRESTVEGRSSAYASNDLRFGGVLWPTKLGEESISAVIES